MTGPGTHRCQCHNGYKGDGKTCQEVDNCLTKPCSTSAKCIKTAPGKHRCECLEGFTGDGKSCHVKPGYTVVKVEGKDVVVRNDDKHKGIASLNVLVGEIKKKADAKAAVLAKPAPTPAEKLAALVAGKVPNTGSLDDTTLRVDSLERATLALAKAAREETEELKKLRETAASSSVNIEKLINAKSEQILQDVVKVAQQEVTAHPLEDAAPSTTVPSTPKL
jgi:hypothetical protein